MRTRAGSARDQFHHDISTTQTPGSTSELFIVSSLSSWFGLPQVLHGHMSIAGQSLVEGDAMVMQLADHGCLAT